MPNSHPTGVQHNPAATHHPKLNNEIYCGETQSAPPTPIGETPLPPHINKPSLAQTHGRTSSMNASSVKFNLEKNTSISYAPGKAQSGDFVYNFDTEQPPQNHWTWKRYVIVSLAGLWAESHGIVDNKMYDPEYKKFFKLEDPEAFNPRWWQGEPIWVTAEKQGKKAATFFWPGSDVNINDVRPTHYFKYNDKVPWQSRVEVILAWLDLPPERRPSLLTLYINEPDAAGHHYGPDSPQVDEALKLLEIMLDRLIAGLVKRNILGCINIIILSDHGMTKLSCDKVTYLQDYVDPATFYWIQGATARMNPKPNHTVDEITDKLKCKNEQITVYHKHRLPKRFHYSDHRRIEPVVISMASGALVFAQHSGDKSSVCSGGAHGYDNMNKDMRAFFLAHGPAFKQNYTARPFRNIEVYNLMADLLKIKPVPNNGTNGALHHILKETMPLPYNSHNNVPNNCYFNQSLNTTPIEDGCRCKTEGPSASSLFGFTANTHAATRIFHSWHVPWNEPGQKNQDELEHLCLLTNHDYVTVFHKKLRMPLWTAFTLRGRQETAIASACWERDARLHGADFTCTEFERFRTEFKVPLHREALFPADFVSSKEHESYVWLHSNALPFFDNHTTGVRRKFLKLLRLWEERYESLNVVTGPAFDIHGNGIRPPLNEILQNTFNGSVRVNIPTHLFFIVTRCLTKGVSVHLCTASQLDTLAFLLPHLPQPENCMDVQKYIVNNMATVSDVELITGLQFFTELPTYESIRLRTHITDGLWPV